MSGKIVVLSGPSGVGKSTICKEVIGQIENSHLSVSMTTRPKTDNEVEGKDYFFLTKQEFEKNIEQGNLLEYATVFGNYYGTPKDKVEIALKEGKTIILEIDVQGGREAKKIYPDTIMIFILPPTQNELASRIGARGRDHEDAIKKRLDGASTEIAAAWQYYEHMVINGDLQQAIEEVVQIIKHS